MSSRAADRGLAGRDVVLADELSFWLMSCHGPIAVSREDPPPDTGPVRHVLGMDDPATADLGVGMTTDLHAGVACHLEPRAPC